MKNLKKSVLDRRITEGNYKLTEFECDEIMGGRVREDIFIDEKIAFGRP